MGQKTMKFDDTKILISDDSILARKQLKDILSQFGTPTFLEAANGQDAIDIYKKESPSLVFLDIVMPIKDGNAVIHEITDFDPDATIIIVSSVGTQSQLREAIEQVPVILSRNRSMRIRSNILLLQDLKGDRHVRSIFRKLFIITRDHKRTADACHAGSK